MEQQERQALVVWLYTLKPIKQLKKFGNIHYISKRLKYIYLYVAKDEAESVMERLSTFHFVRKVEPSLRQELRMDFTQILPELREEIEKEKAEKKSCRTIIKKKPCPSTKDTAFHFIIIIGRFRIK